MWGEGSLGCGDKLPTIYFPHPAFHLPRRIWPYTVASMVARKTMLLPGQIRITQIQAAPSGSTAN